MTPKPSACSKGNIAFLVCKSKDCEGNPFVCGNQCECQVKHKYCEVKNWELIKTMFTTEKKQQLRYKEIEIIHRQLQETVKEACESFTKWKEENVSKNTKQFVQIVQSEGSMDDNLTGNFIYQILAETELEKTQQSMIKIKHANILKLTNSILQQLEAIKHIEYLKIDSKIAQDVETIQSFFPQSLKRLKLLYRASQNNFDIKKFHSSCDGIPNTLLFVQNEFGRVLGGFTPIPWTSKQTLEKVEDASMKSFIFSYTFKQKLTNQKYPAVCHKATDGPVFGINDLKILDKNNLGSGVFSREYNNSKNYSDNQATYTLFTGKPSDGSVFKIKEWEMFEVELLE